MAEYPELHGRVAIVTGAARGIGAAIARALVAQGCQVAACDIAAASDRGDANVHPYQCDVRDPDQVASVVQDVQSRCGTIDILINNAGISKDAVVWKMTDEQWNDVLDINLKGCFHFIRAVAPVMRAQKSGRIVNLASINGERGKFGLANYAASKAGVAALTMSVARELGAFNVTVNAVAPGMILTDLTSSLPEKFLDTAAKESALGRIGKPEDVAGLVAFLCSNDAQHITGTVIRIDGGQCLG